MACPKPASSLLMGFRRQREAFWTGFKSLSAAGRPLAASLWPVRSLPPLFLWASEGNVRHFGPASKARQASCGLSVACPKPASSLLMGFRRQRYRHFGPASKASRQPAGLLRPLCGLSEACLLSSYGLPKATLGILARLQTLPRASPQPCPPRQLAGLPLLFLWASEGNVRHFGSASNAPQSLTAALPSSRQLAGLPLLFLWASESDVRHFRLSAAGRPLAASLWPVRSLPPLFLWASEGNVRHFGPASKASRQPAGLLRPLCGLSEACLLSSYGLPKATLGILARLQTLPRASPQPCPLLGSWLNASIGVKPIQVSLLNPRKLSRFNRQTLEMKRGRRHPGGALTIC